MEMLGIMLLHPAPRRLYWVSGRTETKTYGKSATVREREEQQTLPSKGLFGKVTDER